MLTKVISKGRWLRIRLACSTDRKPFPNGCGVERSITVSLSFGAKEIVNWPSGVSMTRVLETISESSDSIFSTKFSQTGTHSAVGLIMA